MPDWSPRLYSRFEDERTRPARDLLAQVPLTAPRRVVDVGSGPGNSTELLVERWPQADIVGLDNSPAMLEAARSRLPALRFAHADAQSWRPESGTDVVFANAIYQWVPDHLPVLAEVLARIDEGGALAVQMPDNFGEATHVIMREVAARGPWADRLSDAARKPLPAPQTYFDALTGHARRVDIWHTIYNHVLDGPDAIVDWVRSTGLKPFVEPLTHDEREAFLAIYRARIAEAYPATSDGRVLLRFPRLFIVATR